VDADERRGTGVPHDRFDIGAASISFTARRFLEIAVPVSRHGPQRPFRIVRSGRGVPAAPGWRRLLDVDGFFAARSDPAAMSESGLNSGRRFVAIRFVHHRAVSFSDRMNNRE